MIRTGLIQLTSGPDPARNLAAATGFIREAAAAGARFVLTPEMTNILDADRERVAARVGTEDADESVRAFSALAVELGIDVLIGSLALKSGDGRLVNRSLLISRDGRIAARYDKIHLFDVDIGPGQTYRESATYAGGHRAVVAQAAGLKLGLTICYDVRFAALHRALAQAGAEVLTVPAAFTVPTGEAHWHVLLRARAIETGTYVLAAAQTGRHYEGRETYGHTLAVDPWGKVIAERASEPGVLIAEIDPAAVAAARQRIPALRHDRPFTLEQS